VTVSDRHPVKNAGMLHVLDVVTKGWTEDKTTSNKPNLKPQPPAARFIFVVPSDKYGGLRKQSYFGAKEISDPSDPKKKKQVLGVIEEANLQRRVRSVEQYALEMKISS